MRSTAGLTLFVDANRLEPGAEVTLGEDAAHHARVRRVAEGERARLLDGRGSRALAMIERLGKKELVARVAEVETIDPSPSVHLLVPVADRERMLWLAEKATELALASWRPVTYARSRSVSPRGEGASFAAKVRARMIAALEQSGGAWLPTLAEEMSLARALEDVGAGDRVVLDSEGEPMLVRPLAAPVTLAVGPEGGFESEERETLLASGFRPVRLAGNILRFETAAVAALAVARSALLR